MNIIHEWMVKNLPKDSIIVEAGVCDGIDTEFFARSFPNGKIYGFEPIPELFEEASNRNRNYSNVSLKQLGLGEKTEKKTFYVSDRFGKKWGSSSILKPKEHLNFHKEITFNSELEINIVNLDEWCDDNNISNVDLMWLDLQGMEPQVIKSSPNIISKTSYIYSEVSLIDTYENVIKYDDFKKYMIDIGFNIVFEDLPWGDMGNVLFVNCK